MKVIKKVFTFLFIGIIILGEFTDIKAYQIEPVTYHIKMYGTIYNAKGKVVEKNPTRFDLGKKQTIILNYVEVNGR